MRKTVFLDTSCFVVFAEADNEKHDKAMELFGAFVKEGCRFIVSDYVISELLTLWRCREKIPMHRIISFVAGISAANIEVVTISKDMFGKSLKMMEKYDDQYFSFVDCVSFTIMKQMKVKDVMTTDKHFSVAGFNVLL